jgi:molecular chaperone DnaK
MSAGSGSERRRNARTPVTLLVQYRFDTLEDFVAEYATNLSPQGMFLQTLEPSPVGSLLHVQFSLKDGSKLVEGLARVVRVSAPGGSEAPGMGVELVEFDEPSLALIRQICEGRLR